MKVLEQNLYQSSSSVLYLYVATSTPYYYFIVMHACIHSTTLHFRTMPLQGGWLIYCYNTLKRIQQLRHINTVFFKYKTLGGKRAERGLAKREKNLELSSTKVAQ